MERNGIVSNVEVARGIGYGCDEEAKNAVEKMPIWTPGKQRGKPVRVRLVLPVMFSLSEKKN